MLRDAIIESMTDRQFENFWNKVVPTGFCWEWTGGMGSKEYGVVALNIKGERTSVLPHRVAYYYLMRELPYGLGLDHLCRNTICVNPDHLEPVTQKVNNERGYGVHAKNRRKTKCVNGHSFTKENTKIVNGKHRKCKQCIQDRNNRPNLLTR